jgi:hypothetical protein
VHRRAQVLTALRGQWGLAFLLLSAKPAHQLLLALGHFVYAPFQPLDPVSRPGLIRFSRQDRGYPAKHRQRGASRCQTQPQ